MKKIRLFSFLTVGMVFLLTTSQVFASSPTVQSNKPPTTMTPGAKATEKAGDNTIQQENKQHGKHENYKGTVSAVDADSITLTLKDDSSVTVGLSADTRIKFPGPKDSAPTGIQAGMNATVQAIRDQSGNLTALRIMVIPGKPAKIHRVGIVTEYTAGKSITIQDKAGNTFTFTLDDQTKLLPAGRADTLAVGSRVTIIAPRDPAGGGSTASGIVIHPNTP